MKTTLIIARHGNTFAKGDAVRRVGITDLPLVDTGIEQANKLADYLVKQNFKADIIFTSQLQRTKKMAEIYCTKVKNKPKTKALDIFNEIDYGIDENKLEAEVVSRLGNKLKLWETQAIAPEEWNVNPTEIIKNWHNFVYDLILHYCGKIIIVFTSNGIARFAPCLTTGISYSNIADFSYNIKLATGAFGILNYENNQWTIKDWNIKP